MTRVTENVVFKSDGYPFGILLVCFWYCKFDKRFLKSVPLKLRFRDQKNFSEKNSKKVFLLFPVGGKIVFELNAYPLGYFLALRK